MQIWMTMDKETRRISVIDREPGDQDFPAGLRGAGWPVRTLEIEQEKYDGLMTGRIVGQEGDDLHQGWWNAAGQDGDPLWPNL